MRSQLVGGFLTCVDGPFHEACAENATSHAGHWKPAGRSGNCPSKAFFAISFVS